MTKVNREQIMAWAARKLVELFEGLEDEVLINYVGAYLEQDHIDPEEMQLSLTDMLERDTANFVEELWTLLVDAQSQPLGIPSALLAASKAEIDERMKVRQRVQAGMRNIGYGLMGPRIDIPLPLPTNPSPPTHPDVHQTRSYEKTPRQSVDQRSEYRSAPSSSSSASSTHSHRRQERHTLSRGDDKGDISDEEYSRSRRGRSRYGEDRGYDDRSGVRNSSGRSNRRGDGGRDYYEGHYDGRSDYHRRRQQRHGSSEERNTIDRRSPSPDPFGRDARPIKPASTKPSNDINDANGDAGRKISQKQTLSEQEEAGEQGADKFRKRERDVHNDPEDAELDESPLTKKPKISGSPDNNVE